jgi:hypothetical protein
MRVIDQAVVLFPLGLLVMLAALFPKAMRGVAVHLTVPVVLQDTFEIDIQFKT